MGNDQDAAADRLRARIAGLLADDEEFAAAVPDPRVTEALRAPGTPCRELVRIVMEGYRERPAVGERKVEFTTDPATGRTTRAPHRHFETLTYGQLWGRIEACARALAGMGLKAGDRIAVLGFTSVDYTTIDLAAGQIGAVVVPLQTSSPVAQMVPIVTETEPTIIASSVLSLREAVALSITGHRPNRLVVFDYHSEVDDHRDALAAAERAMAARGATNAVVTLQETIECGQNMLAPTALADDTDALSLLIYTSGSTGTPKGAMYPDRLMAQFWRPPAAEPELPMITLNFMPMSHGLGRGTLYTTLSRGGTAYFAASSDLSTFLEDLAMVRPTVMTFVPRIWEMIFDAYRMSTEQDFSSALAEHRRQLIGDRYYAAVTGSAPTTVELKTWVEGYLDIHVSEGYGSTEQGVVVSDGVIKRPPVIDYKLVDVPELGYFRTDRPHPRGELLVKSDNIFDGYYRRPDMTTDVFDDEGFYRTGDVVAELGPDHIKYLDRRNNVLKLSQGEFVAVSNLEAAFGGSPLVRQIYVYGNSSRAYVLAVIVPTDDALARFPGSPELRSALADSLQAIAREAKLQSYETPRDFLIETTPFTLENGLLTGIRKLARPKLKAHYSAALEQLYVDLEEGQAAEWRNVRHGVDDRPVLDTVMRAVIALLGSAGSGVQPHAHFIELGGDSLSALTFANLLGELFDVDVPVGLIVSPASDLTAIAAHVEAERAGGTKRPTYAAVHGRDAAEISAADLRLGAFIDAETLSAAPALRGPSPEVRTVLLTGATGFLGRYLALEWLERMDVVGGKVICLVRAKDDAGARARLDATFDTDDPKLLARYRELAAEHLEVIAGDKSEANLGVDPTTWQRLADTVDVIVDPAALVNHVLPYSQLFGPNVLGTAELIRVALTIKLKPFAYVSTIGVGAGIALGAFTEDADIRTISAIRRVDDSYANGYAISKWAGEVLLREAHELCGLPVSVFRCDMILADTSYAGQLNLTDMVTRLILSLVATGVAPQSFYELDAAGRRQRAHYDGLPVEFVAEAISTLGAAAEQGYQTYHVMNPHDDGIGMDTFVDWIVEAGYPIIRIDDYATWLQRFETTLRALPDVQRQASLLPLLHNYQRPQYAINGAMAPTQRFRAAVCDAKIGPDPTAPDIPHVTAPVIVKYITDLTLLGML